MAKHNPNLVRDSQCPTYGHYFHRLGIARHRAMHRDEQQRENSK